MRSLADASDSSTCTTLVVGRIPPLPTPLGRATTRIPKHACGVSERILTWGLRALWFSLPWSAGRMLGEALAQTSPAFATTASIGAWGGWALGLAGVLILSASGLTTIRFLAPAGLAATCWAAAAGAADISFAAVAGVICTGLVCVTAALPTLGSRFIDAMSYGDERRLPLRPPQVVLLILLPLSWAVTLGGLTAGPLLLAAGHGLAGALLLGFGLPAAAAGVRSMHSLSRRWLVFVPGGVVLHDHLAVSAPVLIRRHQIASLRPAPGFRSKEDPPVRDLSAGASGLVLELRLGAPMKMPLRTTGALEEVEAILLVPTRPKLALEVASERSVPLK